MSSEKAPEPKALKILVVARWPLGGIRTYMRYTYKYLPKNCFEITILAPKTIEQKALEQDAEELGARLILVDLQKGRNRLYFKIFQLLAKEKFDIIQSHGFISATHVYPANWFFRVPHVLTIHGIIEDRKLGKGLGSILKRMLLRRVINNADVLYGVSQDILEHVRDTMRVREGVKKVVIRNGIDVAYFVNAPASDSSSLRETLGIPNSVFLVGYLGRFMPEKGFNYLIDATAILEKKYNDQNSIKVLAVGSGDYLKQYKKQISERGLNHRFIFLPFQRDVIQVYKAVDAVVMPSIWEAYPLQPAEAMCLGIPIIVSDCIGLREAVKGTPAIVIPSQNPYALADAIHNVALSPPKEIFQKFATKAMERYDVQKTAKKLGELLESLL